MEFDSLAEMIHGIDLFLIIFLILLFIFRTEIRNIASAILLFFSSRISVGDFVEIEGIRGKVLSIGFNVGIKNKKEGYMAYIPSSVALKSVIVNYTLGNGNNYYEDFDD